MSLNQNIIESGKRTLQIEGQAVLNAINNLGKDFEQAVQLIFACKGRVIVTGIGKSAHIASKVVATLNSTGTPAIFMHAAEAIHGDLGALLKDDVVICISNSGNSPEIKDLIPFIKSRGNQVIAIVGNQNGFLAKQADFVIDSSIDKEACSNNLAPTTSTTVQMALGDAIAVALIDLRGFSSEDFARSHPGGALGKQLFLKIEDVVGKNEKPVITPNDTIQATIYEISSKRLGATAVVEGGKIVGIVTDGDIRRMIQDGKEIGALKASDIMGKSPKTIEADTLASEALAVMQKHNISQIIVTNDGDYAGMVHLHDLLKEGINA